METDEHLQPKVFEEPEASDVQHLYEDDDLAPPQDVDEYVPESVDNGECPYEPHDVYDDFPNISENVRQPATDIRFKHRRIGDDHEITTNTKSNVGKAEKARLTVMARTDDLKGLTKLARLCMGRFRERGEGKYSLNDHLPGDKWSAGGRKLQVGVRSMVAGASVIGVPDEAVLFTTINFGATPELPTWLKAGGAKPEDVFDYGMKRIQAALREVRAEHVMREGFSEVAQAVNADEDNERCAVYAKAYAREHWPEGLLWDDQSEKVFVPHIHAVFVLIDEDGQYVTADRFKEALKRQFPLPRAVRVEAPRDTRWGSPDASVSEKVAAFLRYNISKGRELTQAEITENIRWHKEIQPEHIFFTGWTSFVETRAMAVPIMRASLLARRKLQESLPDFEIGPGRRVEVSPEAAQEAVGTREAGAVVIRLEGYRKASSRLLEPSEIDRRRGEATKVLAVRVKPVVLHFDCSSRRADGAHQTEPITVTVANDNQPPVGARAGPDPWALTSNVARSLRANLSPVPVPKMRAYASKRN